MRGLMSWVMGLARGMWRKPAAAWDPYSEMQDDMTVIPPALRRKANG